MRRLDIRKIVGSNFLAGSNRGRRDFPLLFAACAAAKSGEAILLDWSDVHLATASYFAATLIPIVRRIKNRELNVYPMLSGLNEKSLDECSFAFEAHGEAIIAVDKGTLPFRRPFVIGRLERPYLETLEGILKGGGMSPSQIQRKLGGGTSIGRTGWLNRLGALNKAGLIRKYKKGRMTVYLPGFQEVFNG